MKAISHFLRITVLGGILFLTPIVALVFILGKAFDFARRALKPVAAIIPDRLVSGARTEAILAILLIAFGGGGGGGGGGTCVMGLGEMADHPVVLAQLGGAWRIGVQTDVVGGRLDRGFHPQFPQPDVGIGLSRRRRLHRPANVPLATAIGWLRRCGTGLEAVRGGHSGSVPTA